jgi:hypothetical protein
MKNKFLALFLGVLFLSPSAFALTPQERKIIEAAQAQIEIAMQDYAATKTALTTAQQAAIDADAHAAQTDQAAGVLKKQVDDAYAREKALASDNAKMKPVYDEVRKYWGLGAIFYGIKELVKHLLITIIVVGVLLVGVAILSFFFPVVGVVFGFVVGVFRRIGSVFQRKPPAPTAV